MNSSALLDSPNGPVSSRSAPLALTPCSSAPPWSHSRRWRQLAIVTASTCLASVGFVMTGHPVSAGVNGCGVVTVDFTDRNTYHNAVGGTRVDFTYERYWIDSGEHQVMTRQTVDIAGAGPTQPVTGVIVAGLTNRKPDGSLTRTQDCESPTGRTQVTSFIWSDVAGSRGLFGFSVQPDLSRRLDAVDFKFTLTLRRDTYTSGGSRWMSAFQGQEFGGQPNPTPLTWQPGEPHPVTVLSVMHGLYSVEMSEANQIHIGIDDVRYAELPSCIQSPYCPDTAWDFKACGAMGAEVRPADKMKV